MTLNNATVNIALIEEIHINETDTPGSESRPRASHSISVAIRLFKGQLTMANSTELRLERELVSQPSAAVNCSLFCLEVPSLERWRVEVPVFGTNFIHGASIRLTNNQLSSLTINSWICGKISAVDLLKHCKSDPRKSDSELQKVH